MLTACTLPVVVLRWPLLTESFDISEFGPFLFFGGLITAGVLGLVFGVLLALHVVRPGFLTGWSAAGNLCIAAMVALMAVQPNIIHYIRESSLPNSTIDWLPWVWLGLLLGAVVLQARGFFKHRKARHAA